MSKNFWHDIESGVDIPEIINVIVEIPKGARNKCEYEKKHNMIKLDRVLFSPFQVDRVSIFSFPDRGRLFPNGPWRGGASQSNQRYPHLCGGALRLPGLHEEPDNPWDSGVCHRCPLLFGHRDDLPSEDVGYRPPPSNAEQLTGCNAFQPTRGSV